MGKKNKKNKDKGKKPTQTKGKPPTAAELASQANVKVKKIPKKKGEKGQKLVNLPKYKG